MSWESRHGRGRYYTRSRKVQGKTLRIYLGCGLRAEQAAAEDEARRAARKAQVAALQVEARQYDNTVRPLIELGSLTNLMTQAVLLTAGFHQHHQGEWRRRHVRHDHDQSTATEGLPRRAEDAAATRPCR